MALEEYNRKRDFARTAEPRGAAQPDAQPQGRPDTHTGRFVVQEHHASTMHYDFRLEMGGVLKSWAVPKGPPEQERVRRLAVQTEDHPVSYLTFSGEIAPDNYGAGHVSIWDIGEYDAFEADPESALEHGKLSFELHGTRLNGHYTLVRTDADDGNWLLMKTKPG